MKLIVKVVEAKYSDTPQIAIMDMTPDFFTRVQKLMSEAPVKLRLDNGPGDYFFVDRKGLAQPGEGGRGHSSRLGRVHASCAGRGVVVPQLASDQSS